MEESKPREMPPAPVRRRSRHATLYARLNIVIPSCRRPVPLFYIEERRPYDSSHAAALQRAQQIRISAVAGEKREAAASGTTAGE